jgi:hypothetical protein
MRKFPIIVLALGIGLGGCKGAGDAQANQPLAQKPAASSGAVGGSSDDIRPITPGAGPITPVAGGENLGGTTGGGVAQVAKERAKSAAARSSNTTQSGEGEDQ